MKDVLCGLAVLLLVVAVLAGGYYIGLFVALIGSAAVILMTAFGILGLVVFGVYCGVKALIDHYRYR